MCLFKFSLGTHGDKLPMFMCAASINAHPLKILDIHLWPDKQKCYISLYQQHQNVYTLFNYILKYSLMNKAVNINSIF